MPALDTVDNFTEGVMDALDGVPWSHNLARYPGYKEGFDYGVSYTADAIEDRDADDFGPGLRLYGLEVAA